MSLRELAGGSGAPPAAGLVVFHMESQSDLDIATSAPANGKPADANGKAVATTGAAGGQKKAYEHKIEVDKDGKDLEDDPDWHTDPATGLDDAEVAKRLEKYGPSLHLFFSTLSLPCLILIMCM